MLLYIVIIIAGVILDQLSKQFAVIWLSGITTLPIIPNVLHLTYVENTGAAFSLFSNMRFFLIVVTLFFIAILGYIFYILPKTKPYRLVNLALSLMLSGAIGNLIDRIRLSYVVDFFDFKIFGFAIFNIADVFVVCGTGLLIYSLLKNHKLLSKLTTEKNPAEALKKVSEKEKEPVKASKVPESSKVEEPVVSEISNIDITPIVRTDLITLPTKRSIEFEPTPPSYTDFFSDDIVKIYEPKRSREQGVESNTGIISVEEILSEIDSYEPVVIKKENRYSKSTEKYEEMVRQQRSSESSSPSRKRKQKRYDNKFSSYEQSINDFKVREEQREKQKKQDDWEMFRSSESRRNRQDSNFEVIPPSETTSRRIRNRKSKYSDMLSSYENLVNENRKQKSKPEKSNWEEKPKVQEEPKPVKEETVEVDFVELDTKPVRRNRYSESTDSYIESIKLAAKKEYTKKKKSE